MAFFLLTGVSVDALTGFTISERAGNWQVG